MTTNDINFLWNAVNSWKAAEAAFDRSENSEHYRDVHLANMAQYAEDARTQALLSIAQDLRRTADALENIAHTLDEISDRGSGIDFSTRLYGR